MSNREAFEPQSSQGQQPQERQSIFTRKMSRRGFGTGVGLTAAGIAAFGFVGCGSESGGNGNGGISENPTPTPESDFKVGEAIVKIENLPNGVNELIFGNGYPQNLVIRKGSTLSTKYMFSDDEGKKHTVVEFTDPQRTTSEGKDASFTGILPNTVTQEELQQGMASFEALVGANGAKYEANGDRSSLTLKDGTKKRIPLAGEEDLTKDKEAVGAFFVDRDPLKKDHPLLENPVVTVPAPELVPEGGKIAQEADGRVVIKDASGVAVARARYYPWKQEWSWVKDPESVSDFTIREFADASGMVFGIFDHDVKSSESNRKGEDFIALAEKTANQLVLGGINANEVFKSFSAADWKGIVDNWTTIKTQLDEGKVPAAKYVWNQATNMVQYAKDHGMSIRAQYLLWGLDIPDSLRTANLGKDDLTKVLEFMTKARVLKFKGQIQEWTVVGEAGMHLISSDAQANFWYDKLGTTSDGVGRVAIDSAAKWAHEADPEVKLVAVDDHVIENTTEYFRQVSAKSLALLKHYKNADVPITKFGIENNLWMYNAPSKEKVTAMLKQIQGMGFEIASAEANVGSDTEDPFFKALSTSSPVADPFELQAKVYADLVAGYQEAGADFALGGFTDKTVWTATRFPQHKPAIFDENKKPKPAYFAIKDVLKKSFS